MVCVILTPTPLPPLNAVAVCSLEKEIWQLPTNIATHQRCDRFFLTIFPVIGKWFDQQKYGTRGASSSGENSEAQRVRPFEEFRQK